MSTSTMRAMVLDAYGPPEKLQLRQLPIPVPGIGEVLVRVRFASINPVDAKLRAGKLRWWVRLKLPVVLGFDFAGEVVDTGANVTSCNAGDRVVGMAAIMEGKSGSFGEYLCVPATQLAAVPATVSLEDAVTLPIAGATAYQSLLRHGRLQPGMQVLVIGVSGGVGSFAAQIAKAHGARVVGVCSRRNAEVAFQLGCARVVDYQTHDVFADSERYDIVFDTTGASSVAACRRLLRPGGTHVTTLPQPGALLAMLALLGKKSRMVMIRPSAAATTATEALLAMIASGKLKPLIAAQLPLQDCAEAHRRIESGRTVGKIVLAL